MPDFAYIARDYSGNKISGRLAAQTEREALAQLSQKNLFPVTVQEEKASATVSLSKRWVSGQVLAIFYGQLADLLRSGVPLLRSLDVLQKQNTNGRLKEVLVQVRADVEEGSTLAEAMNRHPTVFNEMAVSVVRAGGEGGFLEDSLDQVGQFTEKQQDLKSRTIGALAYPAVLAVFGTGVVIVLLVYFVPKFAELFDRLRSRGQLPMITEWLLWMSETLQAYGIFMLVGLVIAGYALVRLYGTPTGRLALDGWKIKIPIAGKIFLHLAVSRFCRVLGTMLQNGVPILRSLEVSGAATANKVLTQAIDQAAENISAGQSLAQPLASGGHFPPTVLEMIAVAEESNSLDKVLVDIAEGLDRRTWRQLDLAVRLIEPLMLVLLASAVLFVAVALLLPILRISSTM